MVARSQPLAKQPARRPLQPLALALVSLHSPTPVPPAPLPLVPALAALASRLPLQPKVRTCLHLPV